VTVPEDYHENLIKGRHHLLDLPRPNTHIETVTYGDGGDSIACSTPLLTGGRTRVTRPLKLFDTDPPPPGRL